MENSKSHFVTKFDISHALNKWSPRKLTRLTALAKATDVFANSYKKDISLKLKQTKTIANTDLKRTILINRPRQEPIKHFFL